MTNIYSVNWRQMGREQLSAVVIADDRAGAIDELSAQLIYADQIQVLELGRATERERPRIVLSQAAR